MVSRASPGVCVRPGGLVKLRRAGWGGRTLQRGTPLSASKSQSQDSARLLLIILILFWKKLEGQIFM